MTNVLDQAQNISGVVSAARFRDRMARLEAKSSGGERGAAREALFDIEERFPELADIPVGGAEAFARERGHGTKSRSPVEHGARRRPAAGKPAAQKKSSGVKVDAKRKDRKPVPGLDPTARRAKSSRRRPATRPAPTPRVDRAIRRTGIPATVDTGGSIVMSMLGATIGLSFAWLVLTSAETPGSGTRRIETFLSETVPGAVGRILNPYEDVFPGNGAGSGHYEGPPPNSREVAEHEGRVAGEATGSARTKTRARGRAARTRPKATTR